MNEELNFHQLRIFHTVARLGSFSRAAEELNISQPAVSIQVQDLERSMGIALLHRKARALQTTQAGELAYSYAQRIFSLSAEMQGAVADIQGLRQGHLIIGASTTPGEYILPVAIGRFRQHYPQVRVELKISNTRSIINQLVQRELDLGMVGNWPAGEDGELDVVEYVMDEIVLVISPDHHLARAESLSLGQIMEEGLVIREQGSATRQTAEASFADAGIHPTITIELGSNQAVKLAAASGVGVGVVSRFGIGAEVGSGHLKVLEVEGWKCTRPLTLVYVKERHLSPAQRAFIQLLEQEHPLPAGS
jgi:DNA-binding transcriptional LysR family regulator